VIDDASITNKAESSASFVRRQSLYDLDSARENARDLRVAIVRLEQFYPFPAKD
jgi:2-oxoglutarate dehydrogenase complex dehydrogenase (E1) component-like enzyme